MSAPAPEWLESAYRAFIRPPATEHAHARHREEHVTLARHRAVLAYRLLVLGDQTVEAELVAVEAYAARFERLKLAQVEAEQLAAGYYRGPAAHGYLEMPSYPSPAELAGLHFCATCHRLGNRGVSPAGPGWPIT